MNAYAIAHATTWPKWLKLFAGLVIIPGLALGLIGCRTSNLRSASPTHSAHANTAMLELNEGKKWGVAKPMMVHMRNVEESVRDFDRKPGRDHAVLATEIQENLGRLVTNCTMEGKAHDELHKWLMPFLGLSADYSKATNLHDQQQKLNEIKHALVVFNEYFE